MFNVGQKIELKIDRLSYGGGRGVARHEGFVIFVPDTAPNEKVLAEITDVKKSFASAKLIEVLVASPTRRTPPCPVALECGGCSWQHIKYEEQLHQKQEFVEKSLKNLKEEMKFPIHPITPSPSEFRYRNRVQLHYLKNQIGYFKKGSHELVSIDDCLLAEEGLIEKLHEFKNSPEFQKNHKKAQRVELALTQNGAIQVRHGKSSSTAALFSQINTEQNKNLQYLVLDLAEKSNEISPLSHIFDLYCGNGNFSIPLAENFPDALIEGVDLSQSSIQMAKRNNSLTSLKFHYGDVGNFLAKRQPKNNQLALLDPPRAGCDNNTISELLRLKPRFILYVSCNLSTFKRDLEKLTNQYNIQSIHILDMFPQTDYMENVAWLSLNQ